MKLTKKILFSLIPISGILFTTSDFFVADLIDFELYEKIWWVMLILTPIFFVFLLRDIWKRNLPKDKKVLHTILSLVFYPYSLYYIWSVDGGSVPE